MLNHTQDADIGESLYLRNEVLYDFLYGDIEGKIILYITIFLITIIGPILIFGIVVFETFGGDSQKRTIINRLLSGLLMNCALLGIIIGVSRIIRDGYGLIDPQLEICIRSAPRMIMIIAAYLYYFSLTIWRYLFIVVWKRMRGVQDEFFSIFITKTIYVFSIWLTMTRICLGFPPNQNAFIRFTNNSMTNAKTKAYW